MEKPRKKWRLPVLAGGLALVLTLAAFFFYDLLSANYDPEFDYLSVLRASPAYDGTEKVSVVFSYEAADSPNLKKFREMYALDKIAGTRTDLEKARNLLTWVHGLIKHDGSRPLPAQRDAIALIQAAQTSGQGLNCRGLAIILSEALLSVGVKARYVELIPRDFSTDSHVVTLAYLSELKQWVFFDPTYAAYFVNAANDYLGVAEIRANLLDGSLLKVNAESNYNGGPLDVVYLHYLSKNLYRFASPERSAFGVDSSPDRRMILLNPTGNNDGRGLNPFSNNISLHNPAVFWAKP